MRSIKPSCEVGLSRADRQGKCSLIIRSSKFLEIQMAVKFENPKSTKILFFFYVLSSFLVYSNTDSKVQTGATRFKTALKVELFSCFDGGPITRVRKKILAVKMNKSFETVIWLGNLEWCISILKRKSDFLSEVFVFL